MRPVLRAGPQRKFPSQQTIEQPVLGEFDVSPRGEMRGLRDVWDRVVVPARDAEPLLCVLRHEPIADIVFGVGAEATRSSLARQERPGCAFRGLKRGHDCELRDIAKPVAAAAARSILEIDDVVADLTEKQSHECPRTG